MAIRPNLAELDRISRVEESVEAIRIDTSETKTEVQLLAQAMNAATKLLGDKMDFYHEQTRKDFETASKETTTHNSKISALEAKATDHTIILDRIAQAKARTDRHKAWGLGLLATLMGIVGKSLFDLLSK